MTRIADQPKYTHLEIRLNYDRAGGRSWSVMRRDLLLGLRHIKTFFTKHEAVVAAERLSRQLHLSIRRGPASARQIKRAAYAKRQELVVRRAAKRAVLP